MIEMERVIAEARRENQPAYIVVPSDHALAPATLSQVRAAPLKSNEASLKKAVAAGYHDVANLSNDHDLDALRARDDFKNLLSDLQRAAGVKK